MRDDENKYWASFTKISNVGPVRLMKIMKGFQNGKKAWEAKPSDFISIGMEKTVIESIAREKENINPDDELQTIIQEGVSIITIFDNNYPRLLKEIANPPPLLYCRGEMKNYDLTLAIVGTRKISSYGKMAAHHLAYELAQCGLTIVSGLALGIDAIAHNAALEALGTTIAILGGGLDTDNIYPVSNRALAKRIIENKGALISEYPCGTQSLKAHFPQRNRIISGLCLGTVVIEAPEHSGSLITAKFALEQNREIFSVPQNIFNENSKGPNQLIKMGAHPCTCADDVLEELHIEKAASFKKSSGEITLTPDENNFLLYIAKEPRHIDALIRESKMSAAKINALLSLLEIKGVIRNLGGGMYCKI